MSENLGMPIVKLTQGQEAEMTQWQAYKTLRDEFAAQAFGPILAFKIAQFGHPCDRVYDDASRDAYEAADRAIQARKETT